MKRLAAQKITIVTLLSLLLSISVWLVPAYAQRPQPPDAAAIQKRMKKLIDFLDSREYAERVSWDEHVILVYHLAQGREPTALEFLLLDGLRQDIGLTRSAALSVVLRGKSRHLAWGQCRAFVNRVNASKFQANRRVRGKARKLAALPLTQIVSETLDRAASVAMPEGPDKDLAAALPIPYQDYNTYFGYLHAHSNLSDGVRSPLEAYTQARDPGGLDFFALTDHGELLLIWPWQSKWERLMEAAETTYQPGAYVTLWGFEWSNPILGHMTVINSKDFTSVLSNYGIKDIYDWIVARPESLARFNHPGDYSFLNIEFIFMLLYPPARQQMVGMEIWNGNQSFDKYYYNGRWWFSGRFSFWDVGNLQGWHLGALGGQDNHSDDWGTQSEFRTAVLAKELTGKLSWRPIATVASTPPKTRTSISICAVRGIQWGGV